MGGDKIRKFIVLIVLITASGNSVGFVNASGSSYSIEGYLIIKDNSAIMPNVDSSANRLAAIASQSETLSTYLEVRDNTLQSPPLNGNAIVEYSPSGDNAFICTLIGPNTHIDPDGIFRTQGP